MTNRIPYLVCIPDAVVAKPLTAHRRARTNATSTLTGNALGGESLWDLAIQDMVGGLLIV